MQPILITSKSSLSSLGHNSDEIWENYHSSQTNLSICSFNDTDTPTGRLKAETQQLIDELRKENPQYRRLDKSVLMGIIAGRKTLAKLNWTDLSSVGINMGSSRGATQLFEKYYEHFISSSKRRVPPLTSPTTTLGNIASWMAFDLGTNGATLSHSITCSTALHSILNACVWIKSGMTDKFIAGGTEAPLTDFTISQIRALGIYSKETDEWYCSPMKKGNTKNTMVLGEGAAVFCLESDQGQEHLAKIIGLGYATEKIEHPASLSADAQCLKKSMQMALHDSEVQTVDAIVMHAPGTLLGDQAEYAAISSIFGEPLPHLISTKHQSGHTFGASGGISLDLAIEMLNRKSLVQFPYETDLPQNERAPKTILINAVGFGGNAVSIIVQKTD